MTDRPIDHPFPPAPDGAIAVIPDERGRLLIVRRAAGVDAPGRWCFPGGRIRAGESVEDAAVREAFEETGLRVDALRRVWSCELSQGTRLDWILCRMEPGARVRPDPAEVAEFRWIAPEDIPSVEGMLPSNLAFHAAILTGEAIL